MRKIRHFFLELRRRKVFKVAVAYGVVAWVLIQGTPIVSSALHLPDWTATFIVVLVASAFPVALVLAWAYELTPGGIRPTADTPAPGESSVGQESRPAAEREQSMRPPPAGLALASVAVLRFESLTPTAPHAFLSDAISVELHSLLSRVHRLRVVSRQSAGAHAQAKHDLKNIARDLNVQYVISGTVAEVGNTIQVNVELDDALDDSLLWSQRYDVAISEAGRMQREIAENVVSVFGGERLRAEIKHANDAGSADAGAWQIVQKARAYLLDYKPETVAAAIPLLRQAVRIDASYAVAYAMLGQVIAEATLNGLSDDLEEDRRTAIEAVSRAEQLAPRDPVVLRAAGSVHAYTGDNRLAIDLLRRAVKLAPYDLGAWGYFGWPLVATGAPEDLEELHAIVDRLLKTSPKHPGHAYWLFHKSVAYSCDDRCEQALACAPDYLAEQPRFLLGWMHYANVLGRLGRFDSAHAALQRSAAIDPRMTPTYYVDLMGVLSNCESVVDRRTSGLHAAGLA